MRRALFITGSRSDYDIQRSILRALRDDGRVETQLVVTGAHLSKTHGETVFEIEEDDLAPITCIETLLASDRRGGRAKSAALQIAALVDWIPRLNPDLIFVPMDREEALSVATAGAYLGIPLFHLGGGDRTGDGIDERVRNAVTQLSHFHLAHTLAAGSRLRARGEAEWRVHTVGAPGLDRWRAEPGVPGEALWDRLRWFPGCQPYAVLIQHPEFSSEEHDEVEATLSALRQVGLTVWVGDPNSDPGREEVRGRKLDYCQRFPQQFRHYGNLPRPFFQTLLSGAAVIVGNSSCGIVEAPFLKIPVVDLGSRQHGRDRAENVESVPYHEPQIACAIRRAVYDFEYRAKVARCASPYGDGFASERIARLLAETPLDGRLLAKEAI